MNALRVAGGFAAALLLAASPALAQKKYDPGATDTEIKIGHSIPYSGPASAYGTIGKAIDAYFRMVNDNGGINGRKINFITVDDGYSPPKTVEVVRQLVEQEQVLLVFNTLGTPTNTAIQKYLNVKKVPQLFVATGASKWGKPKQYPWTMGWQPDYATEGALYAKYVLANIPDAKIGLLYQNDDFGKDYLEGFKRGLGKANMAKLVAEVSFEITDPTIDSQIIQLKASGANVFINTATPKAAAQAIRKAAEIGWKPTQFLTNVSSNIKTVLEPAGADNAKGIITADYRKDPSDPQWSGDKGVADWRAWMAKYNPDANIGDQNYVYGYSVAQTMEKVLQDAGDNLTRANIMKVAADIKDLQLPMLLPGVKINTAPDDFYPIEAVQLAKFNGKTWELFGSVIESTPTE
ncbi:MAG: ABC transporter substrate-binding protein [Reyranellaceae bacterium]